MRSIAALVAQHVLHGAGVALIALTGLVAADAAVPTPAAAAEPAPRGVALVQDRETQRLSVLRTVVKGALTDPADTEGPMIISEIVSDGRPQGVSQALAAAWEDPRVGLVIAIGEIGSHLAVTAPSLPKPTLAASLLSPAVQGLTPTEGRTGRAHLSVLGENWSPRLDLATFRDVVGVKHAAILVRDVLLAAAPEMVDALRFYLAQVDIRVSLIPVGDDTAKAILGLAGDVDGVYLGPLLDLGRAERTALVAAAGRRTLPTFSWRGREDVEGGVLLGVATPADPKERGATIAAMARRIVMLGEDQLIGQDAVSGSLVINMRTAKAIGFAPPLRVTTEAELLHAVQDATDGEPIGLRTAVLAAIEASPALNASRRALQASQHEAKRAWAGFLPRVDLSIHARLLDNDDAVAGFGGTPERLLGAGLRIEQPIYRESTWAASDVADAHEQAAVAGVAVARQQVIAATTRAYLTVLISDARLRVLKRDLQRTRQLHSVAASRAAKGQSHSADVRRWESRMAQARSRVIAADAARERAAITLRRHLGVPLSDPLLTRTSEVAEAVLTGTHQRLLAGFTDAAGVRGLQDFLSTRATRGAPAVARIDRQIAAQVRIVEGAERAYWAPDVVAVAGVDQQLLAGGAGADGLRSQTPDVVLPDVGPTRWYAGITVDLPLFEGTGRYAKAAAARAELMRLRALRTDLVQRLEAQVRAQVRVAAAGWASVSLAKDAAKGAGAAVAGASNAYRRGDATLAAVTDAQDAARDAELDAASAGLAFFADLIAAQSADGRAFFLMSAAEQDDWLRGAEAAMAAARIRR